MKHNRFALIIHIATKKYKFFKAVLLCLSTTALFSAYAEVCPQSKDIQFDKRTQKWQTATGSWKSDAGSEHASNQGNLTLTSVKLKIDHKKGDSAECTYVASNKEKIVLKKTTNSSGKKSIITVAEITPDNMAEWSNKELNHEFVCNPANNVCAFHTYDPYGLIPLWQDYLGSKIIAGHFPVVAQYQIEAQFRLHQFTLQQNACIAKADGAPYCFPSPELHDPNGIMPLKIAYLQAQTTADKFSHVAQLKIEAQRQFHKFKYQQNLCITQTHNASYCFSSLGD